MPKRIAIVIIAILCSMSLAYQFHSPEAVSTFKVEQIGVRI